MSLPPEKACRKCRIVKPIESFYPKDKKTGRKSSYCPDCESVISKQWRLENAETIREKARKYRTEKRDQLKAQQKRWYELNRLHVIAKSKRHSLANPEKSAEHKRLSAQRCKEQRRNSRKAWKKRNPQALTADKHKRRTKERNANGNFTKQQWIDLCLKYNGKCLACSRSDVKLTVDHVISLDSGGSNTIDNIQPLCGYCNSSKGIKTIDYRLLWLVNGHNENN